MNEAVNESLDLHSTIDMTCSRGRLNLHNENDSNETALMMSYRRRVSVADESEENITKA